LRLQFDATKPELYTKTLVEEFIDNIEMSWDDVMTDAIVNCSLVIRGEFRTMPLIIHAGPKPPESMRNSTKTHNQNTLNLFVPFSFHPANDNDAAFSRYVCMLFGFCK
jgi:hypothetical protein